ncbi:MAG: calcium/sodium antiporter [Thermoflexales bacterium]
MDVLAVVLLIVGLVMLTLGAEWLVRGAAKLALALGISPLVIGLTVVAFGTSAPELAVSIRSALIGQADIAMGNVVGSNIANVLLILGLSASIAPLVVHQQLVRFDVPLMILVSVVTALFALDGVVGRLEGIILFAGVVIYTVFLAIKSRQENEATVIEEYEEEFGKEPPRGALQIGLTLGLVAIGLVLLTFGSRLLVDAAVALARWLGVSEVVIGLTIVAVGTSLPELATSVMAAIRGERDIAAGNVVGSNIFNLLSVLGLTAAVAPSGVSVAPSLLRFDIPFMLAVAVACLPIFFTGNRISRWEGVLFTGYYIGYTAYLVLNATQHELLPIFSSAMLWFVVPLTVLTIVVTLVQDLQARRSLTQAG